MQKRKKPVVFMLIFSAIILFLFLLMQPLSLLHFHEKISVLFPSGLIAFEQRDLLLIIQALMLIIIIPVYILTFVFSWKYRSDHPKEKYDPDIVDNVYAEFIWWGVPIVMTFIVAALTWVKTYELDPYRPIASDKKPITIQVVAMQWKWLFIYPEEKIATLNFLQLPKNTPINFEITADAPMNSFWIPDLGGQIYAMPKMKTKLHLIANDIGDFRGSSANLSGEGFADMHFLTRVTSEEDYRKWIETSKTAAKSLDKKSYEALAMPSQKNPPETFVLNDNNLFMQIMSKYMYPEKKE